MISESPNIIQYLRGLSYRVNGLKEHSYHFVFDSSIRKRKEKLVIFIKLHGAVGAMYIVYLYLLKHHYVIVAEASIFVRIAMSEPSSDPSQDE